MEGTVSNRLTVAPVKLKLPTRNPSQPEEARDKRVDQCKGQ